VECKDLAVQWFLILIFFLLLSPSDYSQACLPLVPIAIHLARTHPDASVRQRVEEKLRRQGLES